MDPDLDSAARALAVADPLGALRHVALREDPPALAIRGVAMAQLGDYAVARRLLARAGKAFAVGNPVARARCIAAQAEVALASRDLSGAGRLLDAAARALDATGDVANAAFVRIQMARRLVLLGRSRDASRVLLALDLRRASPHLAALSELTRAAIAVRSLQAVDARSSLSRALGAARAAKIPALVAEVEVAMQSLDVPVARAGRDGDARRLGLAEVEAIVRSGALVVDACRREVRAGSTVVSLVTRPVLFAIATTLGEAAPAEATREGLFLDAFGAKRSNDSLRARLRVEVGRLRLAVAAIAEVRATPNGFALSPRRGDRVHVLLPPAPGAASPVLALLGAGESWSTSGLAAALGQSQRTVQRLLGALEAEGKVQAVGAGRSRRWIAPPPAGFATTLLLVTRAPRV